jgi:hypothetical protein
MRLPKLRIWMLLLVVGLVAFVINDVIGVQRRKEEFNAWRSLKLTERNYLTMSKQHADAELDWVKKAGSWDEFTDTARIDLERYDSSLIGDKHNSKRDDFHSRLLDTVRFGEQSAKFCRLMASRACNLKRKYAHAATHPAEPITPDPPGPIEPRIDSFIDDLNRRRTVDWRRSGFADETNWDVLMPLGRPKGAG